MSTKKISELGELTTPASDDIVAIVDTSTATTKKISVGNLIYSHPTTDGNLHVPATLTTNNGKYLKAGSTAGSLSWDTVLPAQTGNSGKFLTTDGTDGSWDTVDLTTKVDKVTGKALSANDFTTTLKNKLDGVDDSANNYSHPATHSASMLTGALPAIDGSNLTGLDSLPSQAGSSGKFLTTDGTDATWSTVTIPKLDSPSITGVLSIASGGTVTHTVANWSDDVEYVFTPTNCTIGSVNTSGQFVVTHTSGNPSYDIKATTDSLGLDDSVVVTKNILMSMSAPTLSSPSDEGTLTDVVYTITSTDTNDNKIILDIGSSNFNLGTVTPGTGSKVGNTVEITGFTTGNPVVTLQFTAEATYSVKAKSIDTNGTYGDSSYSATDSLTIQNNINPVITNMKIDGTAHGSYVWADLNAGTTNYEINGATDPDGTDSAIVYSIVNISDSNLTTGSGGVAGADNVTLTVATIGSDITGVTFNVRATDEDGGTTDSAQQSIDLVAVAYMVLDTANTTVTPLTEGDYKVLVYTGTGVFAVTTVGTNPIDYLVIGGGGGGGWKSGGGGGAGGLRLSWNGEMSGGGNTGGEAGFTVANSTSYSITIAGGGAAGTSGSSGGSDSTNSTFSSIATVNGGGGSCANAASDGLNGASGGGAVAAGAAYNGGAGTTNQGFAGGGNVASSPYPSGGGGGASEVGVTGTGSQSGNGGDGLATTIITTSNATTKAVGEVSGSSVYFAGGGGGGHTYQGSAFGTGGLGGGADGQTNNIGLSGGAGTGGGGAGGSNNSPAYNGGAGGSGLVIIRYKYQ